MNSEKIQNNATVITATLEEEGMMPVVELKDYTNLDEKEIQQALDWLSSNEKVRLFSYNENDLNVMLIY